MNDTRHTHVDTALGKLLLVARGPDVVGCYVPHHWRPPAPDSLGRAVAAPGDPVLTPAAEQLHEYLDGGRTAFDVPLTTSADVFSERVWALLRELPYGETTTYGRLAERLGDRALAQRVGRAVGDNPISVLIPCHRVLGADGSLTGYAGGLDSKRRLLDVEMAGARLF